MSRKILLFVLLLGLGFAVFSVEWTFATDPEIDANIEDGIDIWFSWFSREATGTRVTEEIDPMSTEQKKAISRQYIEEIWNSGNLEVVDRIIAEAFVLHRPTRNLIGQEALKQYVTAFRKIFPNVRFTIEDQLAKGDQVVTLCTITGTHSGGFPGIPPTGTHFTSSGAVVTRLSGGKIFENRAHWARLNMAQQLDVMLDGAVGIAHYPATQLKK
jgi:predicted ester cyclase